MASIMVGLAEFVIEDMDDGRTLVLTGRWTAAAEKAVDRPDVDGVWLNYARGYSEPDLSFVGEWPIKRLLLIDRSVTDLSPLGRLGATLEELSFQAAFGVRLDLSSFPNLRSLAAGWDAIRETLHEPMYLSSLRVTDYGERDLQPLAVQPSLQTVQFKVARQLETADGAVGLPTLTALRVADAPRLTDLDQVSASQATLHELALESCPSIGRLDSLSGLSELRFLGMGDCGPIASLRPLATLTRLERLYAWGTTRVLDGDLSPLLKLPRLAEVRMRDRREYRPRLADVASRLQQP